MSDSSTTPRPLAREPRATPAPELALNARVAALRDPERWWAAQQRRLAAQLLLALPESVPLRSLAGDLGDPPADQLARAVAAEANVLHAALKGETGHPLGRMAAAHQLSPFEVDLFTMAMLPELDDRFGDALSKLRGGPRRPTLGLALRLLVGSEADRLRLWRWLYARDPWRLGLLIPPEPGQPWADRELLPSPALCAGALGAVPASLSRGAQVQLLRVGDDALEVLRPSLVRVLDDLDEWRVSSRNDVVWVSGDAALARELAEAVAARLDVKTLRITGANDATALREAAALAWMHGALVVIEVANDTPPLMLPADWSFPLLAILLAPSGARIELPPGLPVRRITAPAPGPADQADAWARLSGAAAQVDSALLGNQTRLPLSTMRAAVERARAQGRLDTAGVLAALAGLTPEPGSPLALTTRPRVSWDSLVLAPRTREQLDALRDRLLHRATVQGRWGMASSEGRGDGLVALLHGEPGTGKTLVAEAMATVLGLPLMRVDLSRVVSKYIGETEKNLSVAFDAAEGFRAVLFFDEADAMFTRRTAVSDAHDRYANQETNYLLQRLESFEGLTLLATNALQNMDEAFLRRIPFVIPLVRPTRALQRQLWSNALPTDRLAPDVDLDRVAGRYDLTGGEIRSAALGAAYAAAAAGALIDQDMLERAARAELSKRGRPLPEQSTRG